jgi:hypothetical protein
MSRCAALILVVLCVFPGSTAASAGEPVRFGVYVTAGNVAPLLEDNGRDALALLHEHALRFVVLEVYRGGTAVPPATLAAARDLLQVHGYEVWGGIATVPGGDFGVHQKGPLGWFNYQAKKTQDDLAMLMREVAPVFDRFVVDDFLCTGDVSDESKDARGDRSWADYRRALMVDVARDVLIGPAKEANPGITMCVKFPQWYDLFHRFGYDVEYMPEVFDLVWLGTETRGRTTQRFGFIQPYLGFVNYRWMRSLAGEKLTAAWFDHGDCDATDFVDQAYQTVLGGAKEIVIFNYGDVRGAHPGGAALLAERSRLEALSRAVDPDHHAGVMCYKPPHSEAGGDLYLMDFLGMLGIPLVPTGHFPEDARVLVLLTQSAADPDIAAKVRAAAPKLDAIVMTAGFLAAVRDDTLHALAGVSADFEAVPLSASELLVEGARVPFDPGLELAGRLNPAGAVPLLEAVAAGEPAPYLTRHETDGTPVFVLNAHTYTDADFLAVGEVLLAPRWVRLLDVPKPWANTLRRAFAHDGLPAMDAPTNVTLQPVRAGQWFVQNYRDETATVVLRAPGSLVNGFGTEDWGMPQRVEGGVHTFDMPPRSRLWLTLE